MKISRCQSPLILGALDAAALFAYVAFVAWVLFVVGDRVGVGPVFLQPVALLLMLVISAAICAVLMFGMPLYLFIKDRRREAVQVLVYTIAWLTLAAAVITTALAVA